MSTQLYECQHPARAWYGEVPCIRADNLSTRQRGLLRPAYAATAIRFRRNFPLKPTSGFIKAPHKQESLRNEILLLRQCPLLSE